MGATSLLNVGPASTVAADTKLNTIIRILALPVGICQLSYRNRASAAGVDFRAAEIRFALARLHSLRRGSFRDSLRGYVVVGPVEIDFELDLVSVDFALVSEFAEGPFGRERNFVSGDL